MIRTSQINQSYAPAHRVRRVMIAVLLATLTSAGLTACGGSHSSKTPATAARAETPQSKTTTTTPTTSAPPATTSTPTTETPEQVAQRKQTHAALVAIVNCMRRHGYNLPEPDANNHINTHGLPLNSSKYKSVGLKCFENPNKPAPGKGSTKGP